MDDHQTRKRLAEREIERSLSLANQALADRPFLKRHPHIGDLDVGIKDYATKVTSDPVQQAQLVGALWCGLLSLGQTRDVPARSMSLGLTDDEPPRPVEADAGLFPDKAVVEAVTKILHQGGESGFPVNRAAFRSTLRHLDDVILDLWKTQMREKSRGPEEAAFAGLSVTDKKKEKTPPSFAPGQPLDMRATEAFLKQRDDEIIMEPEDIVCNFASLVRGQKKEVAINPKHARAALTFVENRLGRDGFAQAHPHIAALHRLISEHAWAAVEIGGSKPHGTAPDDFRESINFRGREADRIAASVWDALLTHPGAGGRRLPDVQEAALVTSLLNAPRLRVTALREGETVVGYRGLPGSTLEQLRQSLSETPPPLRRPEGIGYLALRRLREAVSAIDTESDQGAAPVAEDRREPAVDVAPTPLPAPLEKGQEQNPAGYSARIAERRERLRDEISRRPPPAEQPPKEAVSENSLGGFFARAASVLILAGSMLGLPSDTSADSSAPEKARSGFLTRLSSVFKGHPLQTARATPLDEKKPEEGPTPGLR